MRIKYDIESNTYTLKNVSNLEISLLKEGLEKIYRDENQTSDFIKSKLWCLTGKMSDAIKRI